ncbi:MAG: translation initiation factor IF-2 [Gemmatimonadota bacterium]|nr:translation initiation factor IF-2 [Gemmatimonadota bacterium]
MKVASLARELRVPPQMLLNCLRVLRISVIDEEDGISEGDVALIRARLELVKNRQGKIKNNEEAIEVVLKGAKSAGKRRRRRQPSEDPAEEESLDPAESESDESVESEKATEVLEALAAESESDESVESEKATEVLEALSAESESDEPGTTTGLVNQETGENDQDEDTLKSEQDKGPKTTDDKHKSLDQEAPSEGSVRQIRRPKPSKASLDKLAAQKSTAGSRRARVGTVRVQADGYSSDGSRDIKKKKKGKRRHDVDQTAVQSNIQRVMAEIKGGGSTKKKKRKGQTVSKEEREAATVEAEKEIEKEKTIVRVNEFLTASELSDLVGIPANEIIGAAFKNFGLVMTINQRLDFEKIELVLDEFNFTAVREKEYEVSEELEGLAVDEGDLEPRPPVVTVMGHVDHGKTALLDYIRSSNVVAGESGGITQHIGAYHVELGDEKRITFLDTPGHSAFTAMRARGAELTDIVVLVVAADDSVMPQTKEAISHAKNAGVPIVVAINKCDLPTSDPAKVKQGLLQADLQIEEFGGQTLCAEVSAINGDGVDDLLEKVLLQSELMELMATVEQDAAGTVVEAQLDTSRGPLVTVLVQQGTLKIRDTFVVGHYEGRVRALLDERGQQLNEVGPGVPVQILGSIGVPQAGDSLRVMEAGKAREIAASRLRLDREKQLRIRERAVGLGKLDRTSNEGGSSILAVIVKADVDGSVQALSDALEHLGTDEVGVYIVHHGVGAINEEDVLLAETSNSMIIGFRVRPSTKARKNAEQRGIDIRAYDVIYDAVDEVRGALEGMLAPQKKEEILGSAEVKDIFKIGRVGTIAGCEVVEGRIDRKARARVIREGMVIYDNELSSLKRFKDDVKQVQEGLECGIGIKDFNDVKVGDSIECFSVEEIARTLADSK